jgi:hypothetical protein
MPSRYVPLRPGQRVRRALGRTARPRWWMRLWPARRVALPSYASAEACRTAHPGCEVWSVWIEEAR